MVKIGTIEAKAGEKKQGYFRAGGYDLPMTVICGSKCGGTALVTAGVHNAEYVGIQAAIELAGDMDPEEVTGTLIILPMINVSGFSRRTMSMVYEDGKNLNRAFPGRPDGTVADRICHAISAELFPMADYYIDLHCGDGYEDLHPYVYYVGWTDESVREKSFQMARRVSSGWIVESQGAEGTAYGCASAAGVPSILLERGGRGILDRGEVDEDKKDVRRILTYLEILRDHEENGEPVKTRMMFKKVISENAPVHGCWYPSHAAGDNVKKGEILGEIRDYFGSTIFIYTAEADGVILYQTTSLNVLEGGPMITYGVLPAGIASL